MFCVSPVLWPTIRNLSLWTNISILCGLTYKTTSYTLCNKVISFQQRKMMQKTFCLLIIYLCLLCKSLISSDIAITSQPWGGRFGDQLFLYTKTKWLAYKYNLKLFYRPFTYSDNLTLHYEENQLDADTEKEYKNKFKLNSEQNLNTHKNLNALYICNYFAALLSNTDIFQSSQLYKGLYQSLYENIIKDPQFAILLRKLLEPTFQIPLIDDSVKKKYMYRHPYPYWWRI